MMEEQLNGNLHSKENVDECYLNYPQTMLDKNYGKSKMENDQKLDPAQLNEKDSIEKPDFTSLWKDFASNTTAHGFSQLLTSSKGYAKFFWIVAIIGCQVFLYMQIYPLVVRYLQKPTQTKISFQEEAHQIFPMITICNINTFKQSKIKFIKEHKLYQDVKASELDSKRRKKRSTNTNTTEEDNAWLTEYNMLSSLGNIAQFEGEEVFKFGHQLNDMLVSCEWKLFTDCSDPKWWRRIWNLDYGTCYTFNMEKKSLVNVTGSGQDNGLFVMLKMNSNSSFEDSAGIILHIGEQGSQINPYMDGYHLAPGFEYFIGIKKTVVQKADPFKNESCIPNKKIDLGSRSVNNRYISKYTTQLCREVCDAKAQIENCGCVHYNLPSLNANRTCNATKLKCSDDIYENMLAGNNPCFKECRTPCETTKFERETSFRKFNPFPSSGYKSGDTLRVNIFFKTLDTNVIEDKEYYFLENLLGDIGGQLGLFSGVSALTVVEMIVLMTKLVVIIKMYLQFSCKRNRINDANN